MSETLRQLPPLAGVPDAWFEALDIFKELRLAPGDCLFRQGDELDEMYFLLAGEFEVVRDDGAAETVLSRIRVEPLKGQICLTPARPAPVGARVTQAAHVVCLPGAAFRAMLRSYVEAGSQHLEKMAGLGRMAAGLAHELNNPAAAARRASEQLGEGVTRLDDAALQIQGLNLTDAQRARVRSLHRELREAALAGIESVSPLEQGEREDELAEWLEDHATADPWRLAPVFVWAGADVPRLQALAAKLPAEALPVALSWIGEALGALELTQVIESSTGAIAELAATIRTYSRSDQGRDQVVDVHEGIETTLRIMRHRLRGIMVEREYDHSLPALRVHGNDLNQVWMNLIDNAAHALGNQGTIWIRTSLDGDRLAVEIADNGPGMPESVRSRVFEPFFTTKDPHEGTGLGLDIARRIIVERYRGEIEVESQPGDTRFRVLLPLEGSLSDSSTK